jgi:hypothetical protein
LIPTLHGSAGASSSQISGVLTLIIWLALAAPTGAQEEKITLPFDGPEFFCHILHTKGLTPLRSFDRALRDPKETVIIIFGDPYTSEVQQFLNLDINDRFLNRGGNLLIATDRMLNLGALSLKINGATVKMAGGPDVAFRSNEHCPFLELTEPNVPEEARDHPIFALLQKGIATNCPSFFHFPDPTRPRLLQFPLGSRPEFKNKGIGRRPYTYISGSPKNAAADGRHLVIAGHGMFMNCMMLQANNDNFDFAVNVIQWLREKPGGPRRTKALFVVNGQIITDFNMNLTPPPPPVPMPTTTMLNRLLRGLEDERFFHWALARIMGDSYGRVVPILATVATCLLLVYGGKKFLDGRFARDHGTPRMVGAPIAVCPAPPRGQQRQQALLHENDPWEDARSLIEQWLLRDFGVTPEDWATAGGAAEFRGTGWLDGWRLQRRAERVLAMLRRLGPGKVSRRDFAFLLNRLPGLSAAAQEGRLTLFLDGKEVRKSRTV